MAEADNPMLGLFALPTCIPALDEVNEVSEIPKRNDSNRSAASSLRRMSCKLIKFTFTHSDSAANKNSQRSIRSENYG
jgi:hypothetical protein